jgi:hypothetical protein
MILDSSRVSIQDVEVAVLVAVLVAASSLIVVVGAIMVTATTVHGIAVRITMVVQDLTGQIAAMTDAGGGRDGIRLPTLTLLFRPLNSSMGVLVLRKDFLNPGMVSTSTVSQVGNLNKGTTFGTR